MAQNPKVSKPGCFDGVFIDLQTRARRTGGRILLDAGVKPHPQDKVFVDSSGVIYTIRRVTGKTFSIGRCLLLPEVK